MYKDEETEVIVNTIQDNKEVNTKYENIVKYRAIIYAFLEGVLYDHYGTLVYDLKSQYSRQVNHYPNNLSHALR